MQLELETARAAAADRPCAESGAFEKLKRCLDLLRRPVNGGQPILVAPDVLGRTLIRLQTRKPQITTGGHSLRQRHDGRARLDAAAIHPHIDLNQHLKADAKIARGFIQRRDIERVIHTDADARLSRQRRQTRQLARAHHLIAHQHIGHACVDQSFGLGNLLTANANRAGGHLTQGNDGGLVRLRMRTQPHTRAAEARRQARHVALERIEINQQGRRLDIREAHTRPGGGQLAHRNPPSSVRRNARPGRAPVCCPSDHTTRPLTNTSAMPAAGCAGDSYVARSATVSGSKTTTSAQAPALKHTPVNQAEALRGQRGHPSDGLLQ